MLAAEALGDRKIFSTFRGNAHPTRHRRARSMAGWESWRAGHEQAARIDLDEGHVLRYLGVVPRGDWPLPVCVDALAGLGRPRRFRCEREDTHA